MRKWPDASKHGDKHDLAISHSYCIQIQSYSMALGATRSHSCLAFSFHTSFPKCSRPTGWEPLMWGLAWFPYPFYINVFSASIFITTQLIIIMAASLVLVPIKCYTGNIAHCHGAGIQLELHLFTFCNTTPLSSSYPLSPMNSCNTRTKGLISFFQHKVSR